MTRFKVSAAAAALVVAGTLSAYSLTASDGASSGPAQPTGAAAASYAAAQDAARTLQVSAPRDADAKPVPAPARVLPGCAGQTWPHIARECLSAASGTPARSVTRTVQISPR